MLRPVNVGPQLLKFDVREPERLFSLYSRVAFAVDTSAGRDICTASCDCTSSSNSSPKPFSTNKVPLRLKSSLSS